MLIVVFLPGDGPKVRASVDAMATRLADRLGLVYRYRAADGLAAEEGSFLPCTFWLAHPLALGGNVARAREVFSRAPAYVNDLSLVLREKRFLQKLRPAQ